MSRLLRQDNFPSVSSQNAGGYVPTNLWTQNFALFKNCSNYTRLKRQGSFLSISSQNAGSCPPIKIVNSKLCIFYKNYSDYAAVVICFANGDKIMITA